MVIDKMHLHSPGGVQRGPAPSDGGLGVSPRIKTSLGGWVGRTTHLKSVSNQIVHDHQAQVLVAPWFQFITFATAVCRRYEVAPS